MLSKGKEPTDAEIPANADAVNLVDMVSLV